jgi:hypothetical protein
LIRYLKMFLASLALLGKFFVSAEPSVPTVRKIGVVFAEKDRSLVPDIIRIFARQVSQRTSAEVVPMGDAPLKIELAVRPGIGKEGYFIADGSGGSILIAGNDPRGLLYGVGKFLRTSRFDLGGFTPGTWRGRSVPSSPVRGLYCAVHMGNFYEEAPIEEVKLYLEDLSLWGLNTIVFHFPTWQFASLDDPAARESIERIRLLMKAARKTGLRVGLVQVINQGFQSAPKELRAAPYPDDWRRRGSLGVNLCPSLPAGLALLLDAWRELFLRFSDIGLDVLISWPYDEGGCGCPNCRPWGARGYPILAEKVFAIARESFPACRRVLSTWMYDSPPGGEWTGLARFLMKRRGWVDDILADAHQDFPRYPLEMGAPGKLPLLNFPEISMCGRSPWGGGGAIPLPARFQNLWNQVKGRITGGFPYSEGIFEDINKAICSQFYWDANRTAADTVREYVRFEFSPRVEEDTWKAVGILEQNHEPGKIGSASILGYERLKRAESRLTPQARSSWRWRILYLRSLIDSELFRSKGRMVGETLASAFAELTRLYHAERATENLKPPRIAGLSSD